MRRSSDLGYLEDPISRDPLWMILLSWALGRFARGL